MLELADPDRRGRTHAPGDHAGSGERQQQLCLVTVLDGSTSMGDPSTNFPQPSGPNRWERTKSAVSLIVEALGGDNVASSNYFGITTFASIGNQVLAVTPDTAEYQGTLDTLSLPTGLTNTENGVDIAAAESCPAGSFQVMLIGSDGIPTAPASSPPFTCPDNVSSPNECTGRAVNAADDAKANGWFIITIALNLDPGDPSDSLGIAILDSMATGSLYALSTPGQGDAVAQALIDDLQNAVATNIIIADTLTSCWNYVPGTKTGDFGVIDPETGTTGDGRQFVRFATPTLENADPQEVCYEMEYDVATCGNAPASESFNDGIVTYDTGGGSGLTDTMDPSPSAPVDLTTCQSQLPVELVDFTAVADEQSVTLNWSTASELNNAGFEVEHAFADGYFEMEGFVEGHGSTSNAKSYSFELNELEPGTHRFRLKQIDFDGAFEYSPTVEVAVEVPDEYFLSEVYPNPFNPQAAVRFWVSRSQNVDVTLHDIQGRQIMTLYEGSPASKASTLVRIDGSNLSSGTYLVRIQGEDFKDARQMTLLK